jgi:hypothetical protein
VRFSLAHKVKTGFGPNLVILAAAGWFSRGTAAKQADTTELQKLRFSFSISVAISSPS